MLCALFALPRLSFSRLHQTYISAPRPFARKSGAPVMIGFCRKNPTCLAALWNAACKILAAGNKPIKLV
jgi:hypothetical protein